MTAVIALTERMVLGALHDDLALREVDVAPPEGDELAASESSVGGDADELGVLAVLGLLGELFLVVDGGCVGVAVQAVSQRSIWLPGLVVLLASAAHLASLVAARSTHSSSGLLLRRRKAASLSSALAAWKLTTSSNFGRLLRGLFYRRGKQQDNGRPHVGSSERSAAGRSAFGA